MNNIQHQITMTQDDGQEIRTPDLLEAKQFLELLGEGQGVSLFKPSQTVTKKIHC